MKELFSLCHLSAVWRTRKHVGLNVSLRGVLQPSFSWEHTECTGQGPDVWDGLRLYKKEEKWWVLWRVHREFKSSFASLLFKELRLLPPLNSTTSSSEHIVPACVCAFRFLPVWKYSPFPLTWSSIVYILAVFQKRFFEKILGVSNRAHQPDEKQQFPLHTILLLFWTFLEFWKTLNHLEKSCNLPVF